MNLQGRGNTILELNPVHNDLIKQFLELTRYQLAQRLKSVRHSFSNLLTFKVRDNVTYDGDQVREMLIGLQEIVIDEVENELADSNYTSSLLIKKLLKTAEEWHLTLNTTISDLEDREKLNLIKEFDEQLRKSPDKMTITVITQEKPFVNVNDNDDGGGGGSNSNSNSNYNENGPTSIAFMLKEKVTTLIKENEEMKSKIKYLEAQLKEATGEEDFDFIQLTSDNYNYTGQEGGVPPPPAYCSSSSTAELQQAEQQPKSNTKKKTIVSLSKELADAQKEIISLNDKILQLTNSKDSDLDSIQQSVEFMKKDLESSRKLAEEQAEQLRTDLEVRENKLRSVQSTLVLKEKELEQKFQATTAYLNMKKILIQKNNTIKELRKKLMETTETGYGKSSNNKGDKEDGQLNDDDDDDEEEEETAE